MVKLTAQTRGKSDNLAVLRRNGNLPGVVYGAVENTALTLSMRDFQKVFKEAGESEAISLEVGGKSIPVLIHEVQHDPVREFPVHVDFYAVDLKKEVTVSVPLEFTGESPAAKKGLGSLVKVMHEIEVKALPTNLPHAIEVDLNSLETLESQITVSDLKFPEGVTPTAKEGDVVAAIAVIKEEVEEVAPVDLTAIEVEQKGKKEEEAPAEE
jgi:large subunit ribosomal protein L25